MAFQTPQGDNRRTLRATMGNPEVMAVMPVWVQRFMETIVSPKQALVGGWAWDCLRFHFSGVERSRRSGRHGPENELYILFRVAV